MLAAFKRVLPIITILVITSSLSLHAEEFRGRVVRSVGDVFVIDANGDSHGVVESGYLLREKDTVVTAESGRAVVLFTDGALSVLDGDSRLQVERTSWLSQLGGRIYYIYRKAFGERRQVKTRFATLGIRGTTFIIYDDDSGQSVALTEGRLDIESPGPEFELYRRQMLDQYQAYRQQLQQQQQALQREFDDYRQQVNTELIEYSRRFSLQPDHVVRFDGLRVEESAIDDAVTADFEYFEAVAGELLDEFRKQAREFNEQMEPEPVLDEQDFE